MPQANPTPARKLSAAEVYERALAAAKADDPQEAERLTRIALKTSNAAAMLVTLGVVLEHQRRFDEARAAFRAAMAADAGQPRLGFPLALNLLRAGGYAEGFALYETRDVAIAPGMKGRPALSFPEWRGEPVRSLVVLPEQGLGDELMFNRYLPELRARGVEVTLLCRPGLARVFQHLGVMLVPLGPTVEIPRAEAWTLATSLPFRLATRPDTVPEAAYLPGGAGGKGIGVMAVGRPDPDPRRALPPELAAELLALPGAVSLDPAATGAKDFEDTRAAIESLALVISVDTAMAHLAGAMGKPCWTLIPYTPDWRWGEAGERSPWYPAMRLFRQQTRGDWRGPVEAVKAALAAEGII